MANSQETNISVSNGQVEVTMGRAQARVPVQQLDQMIRVLTATRSFVTGTAGTTAALADTAPTPPPAAAPPAKTTSTRRAKGGGDGGGSKRRSRKRVGDQLVSWMEGNPGWHSEAELLEAVKENNMTDASPRRALKIALGKQRGDTFESDDKGHWKLIADKGAGPPPAKPAKKAKKSKAKGNKSEAKSTEKKPRTVLVKKGQDRKKASMADGEEDARASKDKRSTRNRRRWQRASNDEVERARRNLLGLGPAAAGE